MALCLNAALDGLTKLFIWWTLPESSSVQHYQFQVLCGERSPQISPGDSLQKTLCWNDFYLDTELTY